MMMTSMIDGLMMVMGCYDSRDIGQSGYILESVVDISGSWLRAICSSISNMEISNVFNPKTYTIAHTISCSAR